MTIDEIKQILEMIRAHDVAEFELEHEGTKLRVRKEHQPRRRRLRRWRL